MNAISKVPEPSAASLRISISSSLRTFDGLWPTVPKAGEVQGPARAYVFQCRDVLEIWLKTIGAAIGIEPLLVKVSDEEGAPLMLLPLGVERRRGVRLLRFLANGVADYNAPVLFPGADKLDARAMQHIWRRIRNSLPSFDALLLEKIPERVLDMPNPFWALAAEPWPESGHLVTLNGAAEEFLRSRGPNPADSRRKRKRLAEIGPLHFAVAHNATEVKRSYDVLIRQKTRRFAETGVFNHFERPGLLNYLTAMTEELPEKVQLATFSVGDEIIATHWGIVAGDRFYYLWPAWEGGRWSKYSPGRLMVENLIAWSFGQHLRIFDLGIGDEPYKLTIRDVQLRLGYLSEGLTFRGKAYLALLHGRRTLGASKPGRGLSSWRRRRRKARARATAASEDE